MSTDAPPDALVVGAKGGIGAAIADALEAGGRHGRIWRYARSGAADGAVDLTQEASIAAMAARIGASGAVLGSCIVATGILHEGGRGPDKALRDLDPGWMARNFAVNATGPMLVAKHVLPLMPRRGRAVFAALAARVGSIGDNRLGGWHGYRASKAALVMLVRNLSIEWQRRNPDAIAVALHPGTVDTALSAPFQRGVPEGRLFDTDRAGAQLVEVLDGLSPANSGMQVDWRGEVVPF